jgi:hypothetical protein
MPQALTAKATVLAERILVLLGEKVQDEGFFSPAIRGVSYGDQLRIPEVPWVCVEPTEKDRQWPPTPTAMTQNNLEVGIYVYFMDAVAGVEATRRTTDQLAEKIEDFLNVNHRQMRDADDNDLVIYSYVFRNQSGYANKGAKLHWTSLLTWRALTKTSLDSTA